VTADWRKLRRAIAMDWRISGGRKRIPSLRGRNSIANIERLWKLPEIETEEVAKVFRDYGLTQEQMTPIVTTITSKTKRNGWIS